MEWSKELIGRWLHEGVLSRGVFCLMLEDMNIPIDETVLPQLQREYEEEDDLASKWAYSILLMDINGQAEKFFHKYCTIRQISYPGEGVDPTEACPPSYFTMFFNDLDG